jgi:hypothetical protein
MFPRTLTLGCALCCGLVLLAPTSGFSQSTLPQSIQPDSQHLRAELDRVNAEIAALKGGGRSVRSDYLLRDKLAEAEALARKLTEADKREHASRTPALKELPGSALVPPVATPHDSAVELEAKADLLSDQARRFQAEADTLARTAQQIRARQALRRRAGAWDRDPLAGFENSKRNFAVSGRTSVAAGETSGSGSRAATPGGSGIGSTASGSNGASKGATSDSAAIGPTFSTGSTGSASAPVSPTPTTISLGPGSAPATESAATPAIATTPSTSHPPTAPTLSASDSASKALQQRPLLDPASLASVRSSLSQSGSMSDPDAIEAAALALRRHAQALEERARRLRTGAAQE